MDFKQIMKFKGTASRTNFWVISILSALVTQIVSVAMTGVGIENAGTGTEGIAVLVALVTIVIHLWISIAMYKARLNEAGWSGWWMLMPVVNIVVAGFFGPEEESDVVGQT